MLDRDLAALYEVETKRLKERVCRNIDRFPKDFMFELSKKELDDWRTQIATSKGDKMGLRYPPMAFTEQGVAMLSGILNSKRAIQVNVQIMRVSVKLRRSVLDNEELWREMVTHGDKPTNAFKSSLKSWIGYCQPTTAVPTNR